MESITKADLKDLFAELRCEVKRSVAESIAEGFPTWKPAVKAQNTGQQHDYRDRRNSVAEASAADPFHPSVLQASTTPIPTAEEPLAVDPVLSISTISVAPSTCSTECPNYDTAGLALAAASTSLTATVDSTSVPAAAAAAGHGTLACKPINGATSTTEGSLVTVVVPNHTTAVVHALCSAEVITMLSPMPATMAPTLLRTLPSECITNFRGHGRLLRPRPWPSFLAGQLTTTEKRPRSWPSFREINSCESPNIVVRSLELKLSSNGFMLITLPTVSLDSGNCAALCCEYLVVDTIDCIGSWLFVGLSAAVCCKYSVQSATHYSLASACVSQLLRTMNCSQLKMLFTAADHRRIVADFPKRQMNSHMLLLSWVREQEELHLGFQFQLHIILPDWYLGNQSMIARVCPDYSLKYNLFADIWRLWFLCVRSVCATVDTVVLPDGQHNRKWHNAQPGVARVPLLFIIESVVLNYMEYWSVRTVIVTDIVSIFSVWIPVQMEVPHMQQLSWFSFSVFNVYNYLNQALYFDTVGTDLIYYREGSRGDSIKSKELHVPWDPGKLVLRYQRKLRLEDKPSFKEGGVLAPSPAYPLLGYYGGLTPMGRAQVLALLLIHGRRPSKNHPSWITAKRHGGGFLSHLALNPTSLSCFFLCTIVLVSRDCYSL